MIWKTHLTKKEAIAYAQTKWYVGKSEQQILDFQLFEERLCMPFELFHQALEKILCRSVQTVELLPEGWVALQKEYLSICERTDLSC